MTMHHTDDTSSCGGVEAGTVGSSVSATAGSATNSGGGHSRNSSSNTSSNNNRRGLSRFSLRRLLYEGPLARLTNPTNEIISPRSKRRSVSGNASGKQEPKKGVSSASLEGSASAATTVGAAASSFHRVPSKASVIPPMLPDEPIECQLCFIVRPLNEFAELSACQHRACKKCMQHYLRIEISESRVSITCPICFEFLHPNEIRMLVANEALYIKYEDFMVRKVLAAEADARWCPAPDCGYAVLAAGCASCPRLRCERPGCGAHFCYHCKAEWHPNQTCDAARAQRSLRAPSVSVSHDSHGQSDVKPCPRCKVYIVKMDDGSCNHMMCAVCGAEFCWLCMKEIRDLHYLSPSGCTFWGKKPWSRKKKILWQLGTLVGAPIGIALIAGIAVPAMIIGIPVWVGSKLYVRYTNHHKRNAAVIGGVTASILVAPVLAGLAVGIGVPILLFYVYGVVPVSLCRSGGCGVSTSASGGFRLEFDDENDLVSQTSVASRNPVLFSDTTSMDRGGNLSIGEASLASSGAVPATGSHRLEVLADVTTAPLHHQQRHSLESETADDAASTRALAGSILGYKASESSSITTDDCSSERVRFDDNVSVIGSFNGASSSSRKREPVKEDVTRRPRSTASTTAVLRSLFFHSTDESTGQSPVLPAIQEPSLGISLCPDSIAIDVSTP